MTRSRGTPLLTNRYVFLFFLVLAAKHIPPASVVYCKHRNAKTNSYIIVFVKSFFQGENIMSQVTITVNNMSCSHCSGMVKKTLENIAGISDVAVDLSGKKASFSVTEDSLVDKAVTAVTDAGYPASR
jgi:copper chaperone CopZ